MGKVPAWLPGPQGVTGGLGEGCEPGGSHQVNPGELWGVSCLQALSAQEPDSPGWGSIFRLTLKLPNWTKSPLWLRTHTTG